MPVERTGFVQDPYQNTPEFAEVAAVADRLLEHLKGPQVEALIRAADRPGESSRGVQLAFLPFAKELGFRDGSTGLFAAIAQYRHKPVDADTHQIGCFVLVQPFFFPEPDWIAAPTQWAPNIVQGRSFDSETGAGHELWSHVRDALDRRGPSPEPKLLEVAERYGTPVMVRPRLGQGGFRVLVAQAYERKCVITAERTLPALEAAHVKPFSQSGPHEVENGLFLRKDLHALFDRGYLTVTPDLRVRVSRRIRDEFENGRDYYALDARAIRPPLSGFPHASRDYLEWHAATVFKS